MTPEQIEAVGNIAVQVAAMVVGLLTLYIVYGRRKK